MINKKHLFLNAYNTSGCRLFKKNNDLQLYEVVATIVLFWEW